MSKMQTTNQRDDRPLWFNLSFLLMWSSVAASGFGDRVITLAAQTLLGSHLKTETSGTGITAGLTFFFFLPYVILGVPAGWIADRLPRKWIMLFCDEARALILLAVFFIMPAVGEALAPAEHHWKLYAMMGAVGCLAALFNPARNATIPQIVPAKRLQSANALIIGIAVVASLIGLLVGGLLIKVDDIGSVRGCLFLGVLFYAISGTFFAFLKIHKRPRNRLGAKSKPRRVSIVPYILRHGVVWRTMATNTLVWGCAMVVYAAIMGLCKTQYGIDESQVMAKYTQMAGALGGGMLGGAVWMAWINTRRESGAMGMMCLLLAGVCTAGLAVNQDYRFGMALVFGVGFFGNGVIICFTTLLQSISPDYIRGRIMGFNTLATTVFNVAVNFAIWRMDDADTRIIAILKYMALLLVLIALWGLWRELTRPPKQGIRSPRLTSMIWHVARAYVMVWHRTRWINRHHVPADGAVLLAANHTTAIDPLVIQAGCGRIMRWVMLARFRFRLLEPIWRQVQPICLERGAGDTALIRTIICAMKDQGASVCLFPEGGLQREHRRLAPFQPGVGLIVKRSEAPIVPVWIHGTPINKHMLMHFLKPSRCTVIFGETYTPDPGWSPQQITDDLRRRLLELAATHLLTKDNASPSCPQCGESLKEVRRRKETICPNCEFDFSFVEK